MPEDEEPYGNTGEKTDDKWDTRKAVDVSNGWIYHKFTVSGREGCS